MGLETLPKNISDEIDKLSMIGGELRQAGNGKAFFENLEQIWDLLPEPKTSWDYYPQVKSSAALKFVASFEQCHLANIWIDRLFAAYHDIDRQSEYTNLTAGHALMQCGRTEEATVMFKTVLRNHGPQWFEGEYRPYLELAEEE